MGLTQQVSRRPGRGGQAGGDGIMRQGRTPGAAARLSAPLLRQETGGHQRYLAAPGYHPGALVIATVGPALGAAILAVIALGLRGAV